MKYFKLPIYALAAALMTAPTVANAWWWHGDDDDEDPFEEARLFFELNDTDEDLGIHGKIDGEEWKYLEIEDPRGRKMMQIWVQGRLKRQGLTELFFESAEPELGDEPGQLDPDVFFRRFPEGWYDIEGRLLSGEERESEVYLSHIIPAAPAEVMLNDTTPAAEGCDAGLPTVSAPVKLSWEAVTTSHEVLGTPINTDLSGLGISVLYYEVVIEIDETPFKSTAMIPGDVTSFVLPTGITALLDPGDTFKFEILVRTNIIDDEGKVVTVEVEDVDEPVPVPGNKSAVESCFILG